MAARTSRASRMIRLTAGLLVFTFEIMVAVASRRRLVWACDDRAWRRTDVLPEHHVAHETEVWSHTLTF